MKKIKHTLKNRKLEVRNGKWDFESLKSRTLDIKKSISRISHFPHQGIKVFGIAVAILTLLILFILLIPHKNQPKKPGLTSLQSFVSKQQLPKKDPSVKLTVQKENGYTLTTAQRGNVESAVSFAAKGGSVSFTSIPNRDLGGLNSSTSKTQDGKTVYNNIYNGIILSIRLLLTEFWKNTK